MLTKQQLAATKEDHHALLEACPGSGKTRCLVAKVQRALKDVERGPRRICCITYTNAAVAEIEARLRATGYSYLDDNVEVSTIHSFCLNSVLRYFARHLDELRNGFTVLPPDTEQYQAFVLQVAEDYALSKRAVDSLPYARRDLGGDPLVSSRELPIEAVTAFWGRLAAEGFLDFDGIVYSAYVILRDNPRAAAALSARYTWILVDEFQDTDRLQVELLRSVAQAGHSSFFLVGDPDQSIYGFAGAMPELVPDFATDIGAVTLPPLSANFRSSQAIIDSANRLIGREPEMAASGEYAEEGLAPTLVRGTAYPELIRDRFLPDAGALGISRGATAVLAPQWFTLLPVGRALREAGVSVMGPGARPYKGTHLFARLAEQLAAFVEERSSTGIRRIERELFNLVAEMTGRWQPRVYSFLGRRIAYELTGLAAEAREGAGTAPEWLAKCADDVARVLEAAGWVSRDQGARLPESATEIVENIRRNGQDPDALTVSDLGLFAASRTSVRLLTLHQAKGREFDAVAILDLVEGRLPHWTVTTAEEIDEAARLLYVGLTRARRLLLLGAKPRDPRDRPSRFLRAEYLDLL